MLYGCGTYGNIYLRLTVTQFEVSYILQQDAKYRKEYLDPQNKILEEAMKMMLNGFTSRISKALENKK